MHHTDSNRRIRGNLLLPVNSLLVDIYCFLCRIPLCMKGGRRLQAGYLCVAVGKTPTLATSSYHLELIILHLFCKCFSPNKKGNSYFSKGIMSANSAVPNGLIVIAVTIRYTARGNQPGGSSPACNSMENTFQCACG